MVYQGDEISFIRAQDCCVRFVDIVDSTRITSSRHTAIASARACISRPFYIIPPLIALVDFENINIDALGNNILGSWRAEKSKPYSLCANQL